jgi:hypothetical protein
MYEFVFATMWPDDYKKLQQEKPYRYGGKESNPIKFEGNKMVTKLNMAKTCVAALNGLKEMPSDNHKEVKQYMRMTKDNLQWHYGKAIKVIENNHKTGFYD